MYSSGELQKILSLRQGWGLHFPTWVALIAHCTSPKPEQSFGAHLEVAEDRRRVCEAAPSATAECRFRLFLLDVGKRFCKPTGPERKTGNRWGCSGLVADCCAGHHMLFTYGPMGALVTYCANFRWIA